MKNGKGLDREKTAVSIEKQWKQYGHRQFKRLRKDGYAGAKHSAGEWEMYAICEEMQIQEKAFGMR